MQEWTRDTLEAVAFFPMAAGNFSGIVGEPAVCLVAVAIQKVPAGLA